MISTSSPQPPTFKQRLTILFNSSLTGYLMVLIAGACWATSGIFITYISESSNVTAIALAFWRDITSFMVLFCGGLLFNPKKLRVRRADLPWLGGMGVSLGTFHVFWNLGVMLNGAAVTTVQQAAMPAIVVVVAWFIWQESLTWRKIMAVILTFAGTVLVSGMVEMNGSNLSTGGLLIGFGVPISYAGWSLFGKKLRTDYDVLVVLTYAFLFAWITLLPVQLFTVQPFPVPPVTFLYFAGLIFIATMGGFVSYTFGLGRMPASVASIVAMSEIAFVAMFAYVLLDEQMSLTQIIGTILVVGGVVIIFRRKRRKNNVLPPSP